MIKLMLAGRTASHRPRDEALNHLKRVHAPLVYDAPADAGPMPRHYVQNHVASGLALPAALRDCRWDRDLVTELWFDDLAHMRAATQSPYYLGAVHPDEPNFVDHASVRPLVVAETLHGDAADSLFKIFVYLKSGPDRTAFLASWETVVEHAQPFCLAQVQNLPLLRPDAPPAFVDGVWSLCFASRAGAETFLNEKAGELVDELATFIELEHCRIVPADTYDATRLRAEREVPHLDERR